MAKHVLLAATMTQTKESATRSDTTAAWSVVVVHEDSEARTRAVGFCDQLVKQLWARFEFNVSWWPFAMLEQPAAAMDAATKAATADLIIVSASPEGDFPVAIKGWIESWVEQRGVREGVLAGLIESQGMPADPDGPKHHCLRNSAHRGAMDYLTQVPQEISRSIPDSFESYSQRADQVTSLLNGILHQQGPPRRISL